MGALQVDYYRVCVVPLLKKFLPDNNLSIKVKFLAYVVSEVDELYVHVCMQSMTSLSSRKKNKSTASINSKAVVFKEK